MNEDDIPLSMFEVDCDGSACGSANVAVHVHPPQNGCQAFARVVVRDGRRISYTEAQGITRLVMLEDV
jgi:hypothetical protein